MRHRGFAVLLAATLATAACGGSVNTIYRPYATGLKYREIGMGKHDGVKPGDPVLPGPYCSSLSSRAMRNSALETFWGYTATILAGGLVATGSVWGATGKDETQTKRAVIAFPVAGAALVPLGTYLFARSSDNSTLAADTAAAAMSDNAAQKCNAALESWHRSRGPAVLGLQTQLQDRPTPVGAAEDAARSAEERLTDLEAAVESSQRAEPVSDTARDQLADEIKNIADQLTRLETMAPQLSPLASDMLKSRASELRKRLEDVQSRMKSVRGENVAPD